MSYGYRARVVSVGSGRWLYEVRDRDGTLVSTDNGGDRMGMINDARRDVAMFERMTNIGYQVKPWRKWLQEAGANLAWNE